MNRWNSAATIARLIWNNILLCVHEHHTEPARNTFYETHVKAWYSTSGSDNFRKLVENVPEELVNGLNCLMQCCGYYRPQRSWGKVIFSQASVILFTGGGHAWLPGGHAWLQGGHAWLWGACMVAWGGMHGCMGGHVWLQGGMRAWDTIRYSQWAGSMHPTGMHSCCEKILKPSAWSQVKLFHFLFSQVFPA